MSSSVDQDLTKAYDGQYEDEKMAGWRDVGAKYKAQNIIEITRGRKFKKVLEVGAGDGSILNWLSKVQFAEEYYAVEISTSAISAMKRKNIANLKEAQTFDGYKVPYPDRSFDIVILSHVLEHVEYERTLLRELKRLAPIVVIEVPKDYRFNIDHRIDHFLSYGHINMYTPTSLRYLVKSEGFKVLKQRLSIVAKEILLYNPNKNVRPISFVQKMKIELIYFVKSFLFSLPTQKAKENFAGNVTLLLESGESKIKIFQ